MSDKELNPHEIDVLIKKAQDGDTDAFSVLYDHYFLQIYRYVYYRANKEEVDDLVSHVFMKAWDNLHKFKATKGATFGSWIFRIAHNSVIDQYRTHRSLSEIPVDIVDERVEADPKHRTELKLDQLVLKEALRGLNDVHRQIILLKYINGLSNQEISKILKRREGNVRILQFRALKELKKILQEKGFKQ